MHVAAGLPATSSVGLCRPYPGAAPADTAGVRYLVLKGRENMRQRALFATAMVLGLAASAWPTTIVAPSFQELVARAEQVVVAQVAARRSAWVSSRSGRAIVTDVTFRIERTLKGTVYAERSLEFLGGTVGDDTLEVDGMPEFRVGDRDVLFIRDSGRPASPLVGFMYGRFRIVRDRVTGAETVRTHDGRPLASLADVGNGRPPARMAPFALSLDEFVRAIGNGMRALGRQ